MINKRVLGQYFTRYNPFSLHPFLDWYKRFNFRKEIVLEPFAGENSLITFLINNGMCTRYAAYDIEPKASDVHHRDTLKCFPKGFKVCVTNPPWLAKNSATKMKVPFYAGKYDDLYKYSLDKCLSNCECVVAVIPESFIRADIFQDRLDTFISLTSSAFEDTAHPVGLALFNPDNTEDIKIFRDNAFIGQLSELIKRRPPIVNDKSVKFNMPKGNLGLIALDNCKAASIRFCEPRELTNYKVKKHGRHITILDVPFPVRISDYNDVIRDFRGKTQDVLMTSYRGIRKDGYYRRRLDWQLARDIIHCVT